MQVELNLESIQTAIQLWREFLQLEIPNMRTDFKIHAMSQRKSILENYRDVGKHWGNFMNHCHSLPEQAEEFRQLKNSLKEFEQWAQKELDALEKLRD